MATENEKIDPEDKRISDGIEQSSLAMAEILKAKAERDKEDADRHYVDPKRQRWSAMASAATDAISGIAGMIGVSNGSNAFNVTSSSGKTNEHYDSERKLRKDALDRYYQNAYNAHKQNYDSLVALRKRRLEDRLRLSEEKKKSDEDEIRKNRIRSTLAEAQKKEYDAEHYPELFQANVEAKKRQNQPHPKSGNNDPKPKDGNGKPAFIYSK